MNKKIFALALLTLVLCGFASAQQITKFGVVDTSRVYEAYFRDTGPVRNYEKKKADFQKQIDSLTQELKDFHIAKIEERANYEKRKASFQMVIDDVYAIGKGRLVGRPRY